MAHIAGAARLSLNERGATPTALSMFESDVVPVTPMRRSAIRSAAAREGLLDNDRARQQPAEDLLHEHVGRVLGRRPVGGAHSHQRRTASRICRCRTNVRAYFLTGAQHGPARFPTQRQPGTAAGQPARVRVDAARAARGDDEVGEGRHRAAGEPGSAACRTARSCRWTAGERSRRFPVCSRRRSSRPARQAGKSLPLLVPQVDADGNELSGVRTPEQSRADGDLHRLEFPQRARSAAPISSSTCWDPAIPFAQTKAEREAPARSAQVGRGALPVARRLTSRRRAQAAEALVKGGYLLADDVPQVMRRMDEQWSTPWRRPRAPPPGTDCGSCDYSWRLCKRAERIRIAYSLVNCFYLTRTPRTAVIPCTCC